MNSLPNELLIQIASHLDSEPPSITKFTHEPSSQLTFSESTPLKNLSQTSWRWRKIVLPILFRYSRIALGSESQWVPINAQLVENMQGQLTSLSNHEFMLYTKMRSKFKSSSAFAFAPSYQEMLTDLCRIQDGDDFLKSSTNAMWLPYLPGTFANFAKFVTQYTLKHHIRSVVVHTEKDYDQHRSSGVDDAPLARAVSELWTQTFLHLEPTRLVVAAPPSTLAGLADAQVLTADEWAFNMSHHYLELIQPSPPHLEHMTTSPCRRPWNTTLIHRRPWSHIGYNEGSSITAYSTYEYHLKQSPRILYLLLVRLAKETPTCCNISSFSFSGVFPLATHVTLLARALHRIPSLKKVAFQLAPGPENELLSDAKRRGRAQSSDFWLEWRESYKVLVGFLGVFEFGDGAVFQSGDCGGRQLAIEVEECMALLRERGQAWKGEGGGRWVREYALDEGEEDEGSRVEEAEIA